MRPLLDRICCMIRVERMRTEGSKATLRGRRRTRAVWIDAPIRSQVVSLRSSRINAEKEPDIAMIVFWV